MTLGKKKPHRTHKAHGMRLISYTYKPNTKTIFIIEFGLLPVLF